MAPESRQLRGWKEIAGHLKASERSVKRWEKSRTLPVHRVPGSSRDAVFAAVDELDAWLGQRREPPPAGERPAEESVTDNNERPAAETGSSRRRVSRPWLVGGLVVVAVAIVFWTVLDRGESAGNGSFLFRVTVDDWITKVRIQEGTCGSLELRQGVPLSLCARGDGDTTLVAISSPSKASSPTPPRPFTLRLQRGAEVRVLDPVSFDLEWITESSAPRGRL